MPKASKPGYYAVRIGRVPGIYHSWPECETQVKGFTGAQYKKLPTEAEAKEFMAAKTTRTSASRDVVPLATTRTDSKVHSRTVEAAADEKNFDVVYCDGACRGNGQVGSVAGIGVWWGHDDPRNIAERCPGDQTNNRAELIAIVRILETTPRLKHPLLIKTDSHYSIQCVSTWISKWMRNGFVAADGKPVKNRALIKYLAALLHVRRRTSQTVEFKHVRGHVGIEGNEAADQLANIGVTKPAVPERDWQTLEKELLQSFKPVQPVRPVDDDLEVHADAFFNDDEPTELMELANANTALPVQASGRQDLGSGQNTSRNRTSGPTSVADLDLQAVSSRKPASLIPHEISPPPVNVRLTPAGSSGEVPATPDRRKPPFRGSSGPTSAAALGLRVISSKKPASLVPHEASPLPVSAIRLTSARSSGKVPATSDKRQLPSGSSGPTSVVASGLRAVSSKKPTPATSKEELEIFASCLLGGDEFSNLGRDGGFDSDF